MTMLINFLQVPNVNSAYAEVWWKFKVDGVKETSRAGDVLVMPGPFLTVFQKPTQRVLFDPERDANPVFHLMETIWMLAGRDDVEWLLPYNSTYDKYAESDGTVWGAYGWRWRNTFGCDQIIEIIEVLRTNPDSRQAVMQMWDAELDLGNTAKKDRPCNTHIYFDCRNRHLNMTVCCRSNDAVWGAYGANAVHFSMLQEVIAHGVGLPVGTYVQMSNNFHVYTDLPIVKKHLESPPGDEFDYYKYGAVVVVPMLRVGDPVEEFLQECEFFCQNVYYEPRNHFLKMARALQVAYIERKAGSPCWMGAMADAPGPHVDWVRAFLDWAKRRSNV